MSIMDPPALSSPVLVAGGSALPGHPSRGRGPPSARPPARRGLCGPPLHSARYGPRPLPWSSYWRWPPSSLHLLSSRTVHEVTLNRRSHASVAVAAPSPPPCHHRSLASAAIATPSPSPLLRPAARRSRSSHPGCSPAHPGRPPLLLCLQTARMHIYPQFCICLNHLRLLYCNPFSPTREVSALLCRLQFGQFLFAICWSDFPGAIFCHCYLSAC
jgi:hypothetical protein